MARRRIRVPRLNFLSEDILKEMRNCSRSVNHHSKLARIDECCNLANIEGEADQAHSSSRIKRKRRFK